MTNNAMNAIDELMDVALCRPLTRRELEILDAKLRTSDEARQEYIEHCQLVADLHLLMRPQCVVPKLPLGEVSK
jgi:hypothetical protein